MLVLITKSQPGEQRQRREEESPMICLDCVISPFSNVIRKQARSAVDTRQSNARIVRYATATVRIPNEAGRTRIAVYGTEES